jgi:hypothetical protein
MTALNAYLKFYIPQVVAFIDQADTAIMRAAKTEQLKRLNRAIELHNEPLCQSGALLIDDLEYIANHAIKGGQADEHAFNRKTIQLIAHVDECEICGMITAQAVTT